MEWIKVSDRLPDGYQDVLVTIPSAVVPKERIVIYATYNPFSGAFVEWDDYNQENRMIRGVLAWTPFPEPYEGD